MNLEPLRRALEAETDAQTARRRADVAAACDRIVAEAEATARTLTEQARREGEEAAEHEAARRRAAASRRAREIKLSAQRRLLDELHRRAHEAVLALREDPDTRCCSSDSRRRLAPSSGPTPTSSSTHRGRAAWSVGAEAPRSTTRSRPSPIEMIAEMGEAVQELWS